MRLDDIIKADLDEMELFLNRANGIERELKTQLYLVKRGYERIERWDDVIHQKTGEILEELEKKLDALFASIDNLTKTFDLYMEDLKAYNDPGSFGRI